MALVRREAALMVSREAVQSAMTLAIETLRKPELVAQLSENIEKCRTPMQLGVDQIENVLKMGDKSIYFVGIGGIGIGFGSLLPP